MSIRDDKINGGDTSGGCMMLMALCLLAGLPVVAALAAAVAIALKAMME